MLIVELVALAGLATIWVSPGGLDSASGTAQDPVASLERAVVLARESGSKTIRLTDGVHRIAQPIVLGPQDSGLTIAGGTLSGGIQITGWRAETDGTWSAPAPEGTTLRLLTVDGKLRPRARYPEEGRLEHESVFDVRWMSTTGGGWERKPTEDELTTMVAAMPEGFEPRNAEVTVYHMWDESCVGVKEYDPATRTIRFASGLGHPAGAFGVKTYVLWNTREGLTQPGQWFHDRANGRVVVRPLPGEDLNASTVEVPLVNSLIRIEGAENVTLREMELTLADSPLESGGFGAGNYPGAVHGSGARGLRLENLRIRNVGGWGVRLWNAPEALISRCEIRETGAGGIRSEGDGMQIADCTVQHVGLMYPSAPGIWPGGVRSVVAHNHVADTPYTGILGGGEGTVIEWNLIERVMQVLHDGGGVYTGFSKGIVVRNNVVRDIVNEGGYGAAAYYFDEQAEGYTLEANLSIGVPEVSRNHMARSNTLRDNVFVVTGPAQLTFARSSDYSLIRNVVVGADSVELRAPVAAFGAVGREMLVVGRASLKRTVLNDYASVETQALRDGDFPDLGKLEGLKWTPSPSLAALGYRAMDWSAVGPRK